MAEQTLKYGLTQPMRTFSVPQQWNGIERVSVHGASAGGKPVVRRNAFLATHQDGEQRVYTVNKGAKEVHIDRHVVGNAASHVTIHVPEGSDVKIIETISGAGALASSTFVQVGENSTVEYAILQEMSEHSLCLLNYEAQVKHSKIHWFFCGLGSDTTQVNVESDAGENSDIINNAVIFGTGKQQFDVHVSTRHNGRASRSDMLTRSVLDGESRAVYHGLINIGPDSPDVDSYQKDEVILLSERAGADAIPNLEIQNNRVRCTHGASIGKLDEEKLFYFLSRGIQKEEAKRMITEGFLETLFIAPWQAKISEKISRS